MGEYGNSLFFLTVCYLIQSLFGIVNVAMGSKKGIQLCLDRINRIFKAEWCQLIGILNGIAVTNVKGKHVSLRMVKPISYIGSKVL